MSIEPQVARLAGAEVVELDGGVRIARLLTRAASGSDVLLGACWVRAGEVTTFEVSDPAQETYFLVRGRLRVTYDDAELVAGAEEAIFFPPGRTYSVEGLEDSFLTYTLAPAPR